MQTEMSPAFRDKGVMLTYSRSCIDAMAGVMNGSGQNVRETNTDKSVACRIVLKINPIVNISGNYYTGKDSVDVGNEYFDAGVNGSYGSWEYDTELVRKDRGAVTGSSWFAWVSRDITTGNDGIGTITPAARFERSDNDTGIGGDAKSRSTD